MLFWSLCLVILLCIKFNLFHVFVDVCLSGFHFWWLQIIQQWTCIFKYFCDMLNRESFRYISKNSIIHIIFLSFYETSIFIYIAAKQVYISTKSKVSSFPISLLELRQIIWNNFPPILNYFWSKIQCNGYHYIIEIHICFYSLNNYLKTFKALRKNTQRNKGNQENHSYMRKGKYKQRYKNYKEESHNFGA